VNWADLMGAQGAFGIDFYDQNDSRHDVLDGVYRPVIKIGPKDALGSHEIHPIHSAPSLGQSIEETFSSGLCFFQDLVSLKTMIGNVTAQRTL